MVLTQVGRSSNDYEININQGMLGDFLNAKFPTYSFRNYTLEFNYSEQGIVSHGGRFFPGELKFSLYPDAVFMNCAKKSGNYGRELLNESSKLLNRTFFHESHHLWQYLYSYEMWEQYAKIQKGLRCVANAMLLAPIPIGLLMQKDSIATALCCGCGTFIGTAGLSIGLRALEPLILSLTPLEVEADKVADELIANENFGRIFQYN